MEEIVKNFPQQFKFEPAIQNSSKLRIFSRVIVVGMGGSNLAAALLKEINPSFDIALHRSYGLPALSDEALQNCLIIASSYSGNTEEVIDAFNLALSKNLNVAAVSVGGKLLELAKSRNVPYVQMPDIKSEPRFALGVSIRSIMKLIGDEKGLEDSKILADSLRPEEYEAEGKNLAQSLQNRVPLIYSSGRHGALAYNWKIKFNETSKIPAFNNVFPETNHNEMTGFDASDQTRNLSKDFHFIFLEDENDEPRIKKRMAITKDLFQGRGLKVSVLILKGGTIWQKVFGSAMTADWASYHLAKFYGVEPMDVPMVEEFKKLISGKNE